MPRRRSCACAAIALQAALLQQRPYKLHRPFRHPVLAILTEKGGQMATSFVQELKRRNVFRVAVIYIVVSWLLMQIGDVMFPALLLPDWSTRLLVAFLILGLPIALIFAWAYEITPDGIKKTREVVPDDSITNMTGRKIDFLIVRVVA